MLIFLQYALGAPFSHTFLNFLMFAVWIVRTFVNIINVLLQKVIDLQDFRLRSIDEYEEWYGQPHRAPDLQVCFLLLKLHHPKDVYSIYIWAFSSIWNYWPRSWDSHMWGPSWKRSDKGYSSDEFFKPA